MVVSRRYSGFINVSAMLQSNHMNDGEVLGDYHLWRQPVWIGAPILYYFACFTITGNCSISMWNIVLIALPLVAATPSTRFCIFILFPVLIETLYFRMLSYLFTRQLRNLNLRNSIGIFAMSLWQWKKLSWTVRLSVCLSVSNHDGDSVNDSCCWIFQHLSQAFLSCRKFVWLLTSSFWDEIPNYKYLVIG